MLSNSDVRPEPHIGKHVDRRRMIISKVIITARSSEEQSTRKTNASESKYRKKIGGADGSNRIPPAAMRLQMILSITCAQSRECL